ncbi:MAG TPA: response regulator [Dehalococcoidia bacterium]|nr:response regulator [Dehalococcoidia bacterium]
MSGTILVVDDDVGLQAMVQAILEDEGYSVALASDGLDALAVLEVEQPALILLDLNMPRMDGYAFAEEVRRRGLRPAIALAVLTADNSARQKARQLDADGVLRKPFTLSELLNMVAQLAPGAAL